jgi:hypothetical protein
MAYHDPPMRHPNLRQTKTAAVVACIFFLPAVGLLPGPGSSLGMPWEIFFCTWGVMLFAAFVSFIGYFACRRRGECISVFYVICPVLLFGAFLFVLSLRDIVRALSS